MAGQIRLNGEAFSPERDIVNLLPVLVQGTVELLARHGWGATYAREVALKAGLTDQDLAAAPGALYAFMEGATRSLNGSFEQAWAYRPAGGPAVAFGDLPGPVKMAVASNLGIAVLRAYHHFSRQANRANYLPVQAAAAADAADRVQWAIERNKSAEAAGVEPPTDRQGDPL